MTGKPKITEATFQRQVLQLARLCGWRTAHFRPSLNKRGEWQTAVAGDGKGFFDLVLVRETVIFAELKTDTGTLRKDQKAWQDAARAAGATAVVWRPRDWPAIESTLKRIAHGGPAVEETP